MEKLKSCPLCGRKPIIEHWSSGGMMYMVKCNNPDCPVPVVSYPNGRNLDEVIAEWNRMFSGKKVEQSVEQLVEVSEEK